MAALGDIDAYTLYALLRLRVDIFVVEQECAYPELDGLDREPGARHMWIERDGEPIACLRVLPPGTGGSVCRIGRVCVAKPARGEGLGGRLMAAALELVGDRPCQLNAQSHLVGFYGRFGFTPAGPEYLEDGIPHTPMARPPRSGD